MKALFLFTSAALGFFIAGGAQAARSFGPSTTSPTLSNPTFTMTEGSTAPTYVFWPPITEVDIAHDYMRLAVATAFIWLPLLFAAYALGRKRVGLKFFLLLIAAEALAIVLASWIYEGWWNPRGSLPL